MAIMQKSSQFIIFFNIVTQDHRLLQNPGHAAH